jgi:hypothetical protein
VTVKELDRQNDLDVRIGNCTFAEACCPGVYSKLLPVHLMNKVDRQVDENLKSIGFIDICCTTFDIDASLPGTEREELYAKHQALVARALEVEESMLLLPFVCNVAIASLLFANEHGNPMPLFGMTHHMCKVFDVSSKDVKFGSKKSNLLELMCRLPHGEVVLRGRFGATDHPALNNTMNALLSCTKLHWATIFQRESSAHSSQKLFWVN